jgi:hypothetical protein
MIQREQHDRMTLEINKIQHEQILLLLLPQNDEKLLK